MAKKDTLFTVAGITTHVGVAPNGKKSERTKIRYGTDMVRLIKMLSTNTKIVDTRLGISLSPVRVDLVDLPRGMLKSEALEFLLSHPDFQSPSDQYLISDEIAAREPKVPRIKKEKIVKKNVTLNQVLSVFSSTKESITD
jgi:hypothetical protein